MHRFGFTGFRVLSLALSPTVPPVEHVNSEHEGLVGARNQWNHANSSKMFSFVNLHMKIVASDTLLTT